MYTATYSKFSVKNTNYSNSYLTTFESDCINEYITLLMKPRVGVINEERLIIGVFYTNRVVFLFPAYCAVAICLRCTPRAKGME